MKLQLRTFLSKFWGNFMDFKSLSSLSENLRSWSADVPLKNPEPDEQVPYGERTKRIP
jgi:hypothetical protein